MRLLSSLFFKRFFQRIGGFTTLEMAVSMAVGGLVVGAVTVVSVTGIKESSKRSAILTAVRTDIQSSDLNQHDAHAADDFLEETAPEYGSFTWVDRTDRTSTVLPTYEVTYFYDPVDKSLKRRETVDGIERSVIRAIGNIESQTDAVFEWDSDNRRLRVQIISADRTIDTTIAMAPRPVVQVNDTPVPFFPTVIPTPRPTDTPTPSPTPAPDAPTATFTPTPNPSHTPTHTPTFTATPTATSTPVPAKPTECTVAGSPLLETGTFISGTSLELEQKDQSYYKIAAQSASKTAQFSQKSCIIIKPTNRGRVLAQWTGQVDLSAIPPQRFISGNYVGNGIDSRAITGVAFQPDVVIIKGENAQVAVVRTSSMTGDNSKPMVGATGLSSNLIQSLDLGGFTLGNDSKVNAAGISYYWMAFDSSILDVQVGSYTGNGLTQGITTVLQPNYVMILPAGTNEAVHRSSTMPKSYFFNAENADPGNRITGFLPLGFTVGNSTNVNSSGATYYYVAWKSVSDTIAVGSYTGTGFDNMPVPVGFQPEYVILRGEGSNETVHKSSGTGLSTDITMEFKAAASSINVIQSMQSTGFETGSDPRANASGTVYHWVAFKDPSLLSLSAPTIEFYVQEAAGVFPSSPTAAFKILQYSKDLTFNFPLSTTASTYINQVSVRQINVRVKVTSTMQMFNLHTDNIIYYVGDPFGGIPIQPYEFSAGLAPILDAGIHRSGAQAELNSIDGQYYVIGQVIPTPTPTPTSTSTVTPTATRTPTPTGTVPAPSLCTLTPTIIGTSGADIINGTVGDDIIFGMGGNDTINGNGGNDIICTLGGNDTITVIGSGNSLIEAGNGTNVILTGNGRSVITTGSGNDTITTGTADDIVDAGEGTNVIISTGGNDTITTGGGVDDITTAGGDDIISAGSGANIVRAGDGANVINSGSGDDNITSGSGADVIVAGDGVNVIQAGGGDNTVTTGAVNDNITTGDGNDTINAGDGANTINAGDGTNNITAGSGNDGITTTSGNDTINAGDGANTINAGNGTNSITSGIGPDTITTGTGSDTINAGDGNNIIDAGAGNNSITTGSGIDDIDTSAGDDTISAGNGNNRVEAGDGRNIITTGNGDDVVITGTGADEINAGDGANNIDSGAGDDLITGGSGNDAANAGAGTDTCELDGGNNTAVSCELGNTPSSPLPTLAVVDKTAGKIFRYTLNGAYYALVSLDAANTDAADVASDGFSFWVVDKTGKKVYKYGITGGLITSFNLDTANADARGITTNGTFLWVLDTTGDKVYKYSMSGSLVSTFNLSGANDDGRGITTDGSSLWVVDQADLKVYRYNLVGTPIGSFSLHSANGNAEGIGADGLTLWVADNTDDVLYRYSRTGIFLDSFRLDASNADSQGVTLAGLPDRWVVPDSASGYVLLGNNSVQLGQKSIISTGNVGVNEASTGPILSSTGSTIRLRKEAAIGIPAVATPTPSVDQQQTTIDTSVGGLAVGGASHQRLAQVFTASASGFLTEVRLPIACSTSEPLVLQIQKVTDGRPNGNVIAYETFAASSLPSFSPNPPSLRSLPISSLASVEAGTQYALVLISAGSCGIFQGPVGNPYSGGDGYYDALPNISGVWLALSPRIDMPFQTVVLPSSITTGPTEDQSQPTIDGTVGGLAVGGGSAQELAQVFTAGISGTLTQAYFPIACNDSNTLIVEIQATTSGSPNGTVLASKSITGASTVFPTFAPNAPSLRAITFDTPAVVTAGTQYGIMLRSLGSCGVFQGPSGNPYSGGDGYYNGLPGVWVVLGPRVDLPFKTVVQPASTSSQFLAADNISLGNKATINGNAYFNNLRAGNNSSITGAEYTPIFLPLLSSENN